MREPVSSPFTSFLAQHFDQINDYLATFFDGQATSADIERYLYGPLSAFTANAGKRHRPLICFAACLAVGGDPDRAATAAAAQAAISQEPTAQFTPPAPAQEPEEEDEDDEATNAEMDRVRRYVPQGHLFADEEDEEDERTRMFDDEEEESDDDEEPRRGRYADDDEESEDDVMAERIIHWAPPITAVVCALIIAVSLIYHFVIA